MSRHVTYFAALIALSLPLVLSGGCASTDKDAGHDDSKERYNPFLEERSAGDPPTDAMLGLLAAADGPASDAAVAAAIEQADSRDAAAEQPWLGEPGASVEGLTDRSGWRKVSSSYPSGEVHHYPHYAPAVELGDDAVPVLLPPETEMRMKEALSGHQSNMYNEENTTELFVQPLSAAGHVAVLPILMILDFPWNDAYSPEREAE